MGDFSILPNSNNSSKHPGIMLVRPSLHSPTPENSKIFKHWTVMHFRDLLNCALPLRPSEGPAFNENSTSNHSFARAQPSAAAAQGITRALRYTSTTDDLLYTIHADNVSVWNTKAYYDVSRRLDLENTRAVREGEEKVLDSEQNFGEEPMVWHLVNAEFAILEEVEWEMSRDGERYQELPLDLLSGRGETPTSPQCSLVTLTYTAARDEGQEPPGQLTALWNRVLEHMKSLPKDQVYGEVYSTLYRHLPGRQPDMHPLIAEGKDGNGGWVVCVFVQTELSDKEREDLKLGLGMYVERCKSEGTSEDWNVRVGVWKGEVFMS